MFCLRPEEQNQFRGPPPPGQKSSPVAPAPALAVETEAALRSRTRARHARNEVPQAPRRPESPRGPERDAGQPPPDYWDRGSEGRLLISGATLSSGTFEHLRL